MEDKTVFLEVFGDTPILRVLDFFVVNEDFDYSMKDIARHSEIGYATLKLIWPRLVDHEIVKQTRKVGKAKMYQLNHASKTVKMFRQLYWEVTKKEVHRFLKEEEEKERKSKKEKIELIT
ncbi:MAG: hypothetical protein AABX70_05500 [Nanoarchaeota archaeon]